MPTHVEMLHEVIDGHGIYQDDVRRASQ